MGVGVLQGYKKPDEQQNPLGAIGKVLDVAASVPGPQQAWVAGADAATKIGQLASQKPAAEAPPQVTAPQPTDSVTRRLAAQTQDPQNVLAQSVAAVKQAPDEIRQQYEEPLMRAYKIASGANV